MTGSSPDAGREGDRKAAISERFGRAAESYEAAAQPQRRTAALVADLAARHRLPHRPRILEIGCGTGLLTRHIRSLWPGAELVVSDIAPEMVDRAASGAMIAGTFLAMDGESPAFDGPWFDLILSSLAFQWFADLPAALRRLAGLLRPGGTLLFSTMGADSFAEWRAAHDAAGVVPGTPAYPDLASLRAMLADHADSFAFEEHWAFDFGSARAFLAHLKAIGATLPASGHAALRPRDLRAVMQHFDAAGGRATYHILFGRISAPA